MTGWIRRVVGQADGQRDGGVGLRGSEHIVVEFRVPTPDECIEKRGVRNLNPDSSTVIEPGDILWVVGDRKLLSNLEAVRSGSGA